MTTTIGIDPGLDGALAVHVDGQLVGVEDMPTFTEVRNGRKHRTVNAAEFANILRDMASANLETPAVYVERVASTPQMGVRSAFTFGDSFGIARGVPLALGYPTILVSPQTWKKAMGLTADKDGARRLATERWPSASEWFKRAKDDGRAEAALIAAWGAL